MWVVLKIMGPHLVLGYFTAPNIYGYQDGTLNPKPQFWELPMFCPRKTEVQLSRMCAAALMPRARDSESSIRAGLRAYPQLECAAPFQP